MVHADRIFFSTDNSKIGQTLEKGPLGLPRFYSYCSKLLLSSFGCSPVSAANPALLWYIISDDYIQFFESWCQVTHYGLAQVCIER